MANRTVTLTGNSSDYELVVKKQDDPSATEFTFAANEIHELIDGVNIFNDMVTGDVSTVAIRPLNGAEVTDVVSDWVTFSILTYGDYVGLWGNVYPNLNSWDPSEVYIDVVIEGSVPDYDSPFNRVYKVDDDTLIELSEVTIGNSDPEQPPKDISGYIIKVLKPPFKIPDDFIGAESNIKVGDEELTVASETILSDAIEYDLGVITVPETNGNSLDYLNKNFELVLPRIDETIVLDSSRIVGKDVRVALSMWVYTGEASVNIFIDGDELPFHSFKTTIGKGVPITLTRYLSPSDVESDAGISNETMSAYIRVSEPELFQSDYTNLVLVNGEIGANKGFIRFDEIDLICNGTNLERAAIKQALNSGVVVK